MSMELISLTPSPFSDRAKWVLKHHRIPHKKTEHLLMFGNLYLRLKLRRFQGKITVPALIDGETRLMDSFDIALYAEKRGTGTPLFPTGQEAQIRHWNSMSEAICEAGRAIITQRLSVGDKKVLVHLMPQILPFFLRKSLSSLASIGTNYLNRKYELDSRELLQREDDLRRGLEALREGVKKSSTPFLLGEFTYADITMACALQMINPSTATFLGKNEVLRKAWTHEKLAHEFKDLLEWRDAIFGYN